MRECVSLGTLASFLADASRLVDLPVQLTIIEGVASGARFLSEAHPPVVSEMTSHTIVLDSKFNPKARGVLHDASLPRAARECSFSCGGPLCDAYAFTPRTPAMPQISLPFRVHDIAVGKETARRVSLGHPPQHGADSVPALPTDPKPTVWDSPEAIKDNEWSPKRDVYACVNGPATSSLALLVPSTSAAALVSRSSRQHPESPSDDAQVRPDRFPRLHPPRALL